jgi:hypothetical protein
MGLMLVLVRAMPISSLIASSLPLTISPVNGSSDLSADPRGVLGGHQEPSALGAAALTWSSAPTARTLMRIAGSTR